MIIHVKLEGTLGKVDVSMPQGSLPSVTLTNLTAEAKKLYKDLRPPRPHTKPRATAPKSDKPDLHHTDGTVMDYATVERLRWLIKDEAEDPSDITSDSSICLAFLDKIIKDHCVFTKA